MSDDRYRQIFDDLTSDLLAVTKKHGKRALREAVRDAARGELLQEDDIPPEELDYPDEDVWTLPPAPEDEEKSTDDGEGGEDTDDSEETDKDTEEDELSEAAERVAAKLAEKLERRLRK